jgi:hypothetical protein
MNFIKFHGPVFLLLLVVVYASFGYIMTTDLWDGLDGQIICEAHTLSRDPGTMFGHLGFYFSQPLLQLAFLAQYELFGLNMSGYIGVNLLFHVVNSFLVYMLVHMLFPKKKMAVLAAVLFAFGIGSYGRIFMSIHQLESLMLACLHLLVLYFFIRNDFRRDGSLRSPLYLLGLTLFLLTGLTRAASFSLVGCLFAYKVFFYKRRLGRAILSPDIMILVVLAAAFYWAQHLWGYQNPTVFDSRVPDQQFTLLSIKNIFRYLNLMFFPMQQSPILEGAPFWVVWVYEGRTFIRVFLTLSIISYSFFGFVFGSRAVRFFIAWTYITLIPFTSHTATGQWLNLSHLYLTSLGFCVILAAGAHGTSNLLARHRWRRYLPYIMPMIFVMISLGLSYRLDAAHKAKAGSTQGQALREQVIRNCQKRPVDLREGRGG